MVLESLWEGKECQPLCLPREDTAGRLLSATQKRALTVTWPCWCSDLEFLELWEIKFQLFKWASVWYFIIAAQGDHNTQTKVIYCHYQSQQWWQDPRLRETLKDVVFVRIKWHKWFIPQIFTDIFQVLENVSRAQSRPKFLPSWS